MTQALGDGAAAPADDARARRDVSARARRRRRPIGPGRFAVRRSAIGRDAARVYTANTIGAIAGALAAGFALVPALGLRLTFQTAAVVGALGGAACLAAALRADDTRRRTQNSELRTQNEERRTSERRTRPLAIVDTSAGRSRSPSVRRAILLLPGWDRELLASGAYKYAPVSRHRELRDGAARRHARVLQGRRRRDRQRPPAARGRRRWRSTARWTRRTPATC